MADAIRLFLCRLRAKEILTENRAFLNAVIAALLDRRYLTGEDVRELWMRRKSSCMLTRTQILFILYLQ